jgi:hypothetical protein
MAYWFAYCIYVLHQNRLHPNSMDETFAVVMGLFAGGAWLAYTPARLTELNLSRVWIVALVAPYALSIFALWNGWNIMGWVMLLAGVLAQWLLVFLSPATNLAGAQSESNTESPA